MEINYDQREKKALEKLQNQPVNVEFIDPKIAPGNADYMDRDASKQNIEQGNYTKVVKMVFDEVDPS